MRPETSVRFEFEVDGKMYRHEKMFRGTGARQEIAVPTPRGHICAISMIISTTYGFEQMLSLSWFGLQNSSLTKQLQNSVQKYDQDWSGLIKPFDSWKDVHFQIGIVFSESDLKKLKEKRKYPVWSDHYRFLEERAKEYMVRHPETDLNAFLPTDDRRYIRENENGKTPYHFEALVLGFVGLINEDKRMMQHALRYLMCMVHTENWVQSSEQKLSGSTWNIRCFMEEMTTTSVVLLADWYAFALTERAKDLIRQCIWDKGLATIDRDMMKHDYLYQINQGAWFCRAGILGGLYLEKAWPHMGKYTDAKYCTMDKILKRYIMRDGGVDEGIGYFCMTTHAVIPALIGYARCRGKNIPKVLSRYFKTTDTYLSTLSGLDPGKGSVDADCRTDKFCGDFIPVMAGFFPGSICSDILAQCIKNRSIYNVTGSLLNSGGLIGFVYGPDKIKDSRSIVSTFNIMPQSGFAVSTLRSGTSALRILFSGSKAKPSSHAHYDKGAFTIEVNGADIFVDRGMLQYDDPSALLAKCSRMHNVITPYLANGCYPDQNRPTKKICPKGNGNEQYIDLSLDLGEVWKEYMNSYKREIRAESLREIIIIDHGALKKRGKVAFHLHSGIKFSQDIPTKSAGTANGMTFEISTKWADEVLHREDSLSFDGKTIHHLVYHSKELETFSLETRISIKLPHGE